MHREVKMKQKSLLVKWYVIKMVKRNKDRNCNLCLEDKPQIIEFKNGNSLLNKRN